MPKTLSSKYLPPSAPAARDNVTVEGREERDEGMGGDVTKQVLPRNGKAVERTFSYLC